MQDKYLEELELQLYETGVWLTETSKDLFRLAKNNKKIREVAGDLYAMGIMLETTYEQYEKEDI